MEYGFFIASGAWFVMGILTIHYMNRYDRAQVDKITYKMGGRATMMQPGGFSSGLLDLCAQPGGAGLCALTCCCPCITSGKINDARGGACGFFGGCFCLLVPFFDFCCVWFMAMDTLKKVDIRGDSFLMCLKTLCCAPCLLCQTRREQLSRDMQNGVAMQKAAAPTYSHELQPYSG